MTIEYVNSDPVKVTHVKGATSGGQKYTNTLPWKVELTNDDLAYQADIQSLQQQINALEADLTWRDPVETYEDLPTSGNEDGDVRLVTSTGILYVWATDRWVALNDVTTDSDIFFFDANTTATEFSEAYLAGKVLAYHDTQNGEGVLIFKAGSVDSSGPTSGGVHGIQTAGTNGYWELRMVRRGVSINRTTGVVSISSQEFMGNLTPALSPTNTNANAAISTVKEVNDRVLGLYPYTEDEFTNMWENA